MRSRPFGATVVLTILVLSAALFFNRATPANVLMQGGQPMLPIKNITIGSTTIVAEVASAPLQKQKGLSGRVSLAGGTGMLFIFDPPASEGFWMKEMRFSLDIIYAAQDGTIVTIYPNLSPDTYPKAFYPSAPAVYVLEVPAGFTAAHSIAVGDKLVVQ